MKSPSTPTGSCAIKQATCRAPIGRQDVPVYLRMRSPRTSPYVMRRLGGPEPSAVATTRHDRNVSEGPVGACARRTCAGRASHGRLRGSRAESGAAERQRLGTRGPGQETRTWVLAIYGRRVSRRPSEMGLIFDPQPRQPWLIQPVGSSMGFCEPCILILSLLHVVGVDLQGGRIRLGSFPIILKLDRLGPGSYDVRYSRAWGRRGGCMRCAQSTTRESLDGNMRSKIACLGDPASTSPWLALARLICTDRRAAKGDATLAESGCKWWQRQRRKRPHAYHALPTLFPCYEVSNGRFGGMEKTTGRR